MLFIASKLFKVQLVAISLAGMAGSLGQYDEALEYFLDAFEMRKVFFKKPHAEIASSLYNIGVCLKFLGEYKEALKHLQEALDMRKELFGEFHLSVEACLTHMEEIAKLMNEQKPIETSPI